ncbi:glucose-6-phosphate dehydrogenase [Natronosporangium hydrolyticum]|uniref:Glucose-6-phosphate 1-dehydrogenase n=1 Tax=Natronosporangium hydrolyticum TaxID=2811111 RepID=A0A895YT66_9ACTN|nr:glucose-6-phosphate dehydrogenase [Natronosporangium hydrolyticum]QSB17300.1 glucose-6-phosphate dehydrogenase [Natronosporangium hydrolyticum]
MVERLAILGAAGDLTGRYLLPALVELERAGQLPEQLAVIGAGRHDWSDAEFRQRARQQLAEHGDGAPDEFLARLSWCHCDASDPADLRRLLGDEQHLSVLYLALPPSVYPTTVAALAELGGPPQTRLVVEKPFGTDLASAEELNRGISEVLPERAVFRVDHFLGKQTVQNVLGLRFANRIFEPVWNHAHISHVEIIWDETLGLEGRAGYYDHTGALRDMLQNHLLQLLALVAMEPPSGLGERDLRDRKVDVLRATRVLTAEETAHPSVRGRYTAGAIGDRQLPDYAAEDGVDPQRQTETFAEITVVVDNWRWAGVPFILRSGKALGADRTEIALHFYPVPHSPFPEFGRAGPNVLRLTLASGGAPDQIGLGLNLNGGGDPLRLEPAQLDLRLTDQELPAYARLLLDILEGDPTLSIRGDEAEEAWRIVSPVLSAWQRGDVPLEDYPAGSAGPARSQVGGAT